MHIIDVASKSGSWQDLALQFLCSAMIIRIIIFLLNIWLSLLDLGLLAQSYQLVTL